MNLILGSGDISSLMMGKETQGFKDLIRKFLSDEKPNYNALASPINALRTGAILEKNYLNILSSDYFCQWKETSKEMDVFTSSIDFAKIENGKIVDFDELKTIYFTDYISIIQPLTILSQKEYTEVLKKKFKKNYEQIMIQMYCSDLQEANLVFLSVETYEDEENEIREIKKNEYFKFRLKRDEKVISEIKEKAKMFQQLKDYFNENTNKNIGT